MTTTVLKVPRLLRLVAALCGGACIAPVQASSHREAPFMATQPKVDASDFYMFNSYEPGRSGFVTLIANYGPLQDGYGGPNFFALDPNALYAIHIDNNGDAKENITFQFKFKNALKSIALPIMNKSVAIPLIQAGVDDLADKNFTALEIEVPTACLVTDAANPVIGGWTTASLRQGQYLTPTPAKGFRTTVIPGGAWTQVSRLRMPLVNEVVIGLPDKDRFNSSSPKDDGQFADYVTNPTLPALIEVAFGQAPGALAPGNAGRNDLFTTFLTGIKSVNQLATITPSEMQRLNNSIAAVPFAAQNRLGIVGSLLTNGTDFAGYPNGRRPKDGVVDISLVAMMGGLCMANGNTDALGFGPACKPAAVPLGATAFKLHDAVDQATRPLLAGFPYLNTPIPGAK